VFPQAGFGVLQPFAIINMENKMTTIRAMDFIKGKWIYEVVTNYSINWLLKIGNEMK
jgi:hypothetical protein